jgi:glycosyltransferase involved in cell wall biosynthesis
MASGCPVIAGNRTSLPEVVGDAGILCDPLNVDDLAEEMEKLLEDEELRESLRKKGLERASMFSWERVTEETVKIFKASAIKLV